MESMVLLGTRGEAHTVTIRWPHQGRSRANKNFFSYEISGGLKHRTLDAGARRAS